jgi:polar amino acid transport system permease protein
MEMDEALMTGIPPVAQRVLNKIDARKRRYVINMMIVFFTILVALSAVLVLLGIDLGFMFGWLWFLVEGIGITVIVSAAAITIGVILGLLGALGRLSKSPITNGIATFYVSLIRGTPLLVQVYVWYLALPQIGKQLEQLGVPGIQQILTLPAIPAGILALGVCYGAYLTETFRAGIQSISLGQTEAAMALGMSRGQLLRRIIMPQAIRVVIPSVGNEFIAMIKDSSLVSLMGVWELSYRARKIGRRYFRSLEMLLMAAAIYWIMCIFLQAVQSRIEKRLARGERRA